MSNELTMIRIGYTAAMQDAFIEIEKALNCKSIEKENPTELSKVKQVISKAFLDINEKFIEQTTMLYIETNNYGR